MRGVRIEIIVRKEGSSHREMNQVRTVLTFAILYEPADLCLSHFNLLYAAVSPSFSLFH
jgi:hypothetical protein